MRFRSRLRGSLRPLGAQKLRTGLVLVSIAVGVTAVVLTSAVGKGARRQLMGETDDIGSNLIAVKPAPVKTFAARKAIRGLATSLDLDDFEALRELSIVAAAVPSVEGSAFIKAGGSRLRSKILGATVLFPAVRRFRLRAGRFFDEDECLRSTRVAVIGARVEQVLFPATDPVGQTLRIRDVPYEVVGVFAAKGMMADGSNEDNQVVVPLRAAQRRVFNSTWLSTVFVRVDDPRRLASAEAQIAALLRKRHRLGGSGKPDDFVVQSRSKLLRAQKQLADGLALFTTGLAALALLVGGTGILGLMLLAVRQRTGEIGLRMAVGARPLDILVQFLMEATVLVLGGWLVGAAGGVLGAWIVAATSPWRIATPVEALGASLVMTLSIGLGFGALPARRAAALSPVRALAAE